MAIRYKSDETEQFTIWYQAIGVLIGTGAVLSFLAARAFIWYNQSKEKEAKSAIPDDFDHLQ